MTVDEEDNSGKHFSTSKHQCIIESQVVLRLETDSVGPGEDQQRVEGIRLERCPGRKEQTPRPPRLPPLVSPVRIGQTNQRPTRTRTTRENGTIARIYSRLSLWVEFILTI